MNRVLRFVRKPISEKRVTIRFFTRKALSRLPVVPVHLRFNVAPDKEAHFWWSGFPMAFHPDRGLLEYWGDDCGEIRFLWQFLQPGMVFFDVGAYHGIFSIFARLKLASQGQVFAFEPSARERRRFQLHVRMNGLNGICLEPYAVSAGMGSQTFFTVDPVLGTMNSLKPPDVKVPVNKTVVETISLDYYISRQQITRIDLMKIDVEGGELEAFRGADALLGSARPVVICEVLDYVTKPWGYAAREIMGALRRYAYVWFDFHPDGRISSHQARDQYPEVRNYLAVPQEKLSLVDRWRIA